MLDRNYYDLVAGLPVIALEASRIPLPAGRFIDETAGLVHPDDAQLLRLLQFPVDNRNLITLLGRLGRPFEPGGAYDSERLTAEISNPETLPGYMRSFLEAYRSGEMPYPELNSDDRLSRLFFEDVTGHANEFISSWFTFECRLRNILAALAIRKDLPHLQQREREYIPCLESALVCRTDIEEHLFASAAPDFGLAEKLPWIERVLQLPEDDFIERERRLDQLRWDMLDELTTFSYFHVETLLAFSLRLMIVERWMRLDPQTGRARLEELLQGLKPEAQLRHEGRVFPQPT